MVVLEFAAGILGFVFRNEVLNLSNREYQDRWNNSIKLYRAQDEPGYDPSVNNAVDFFQRTVCLLYSFNLHVHVFNSLNAVE